MLTNAQAEKQQYKLQLDQLKLRFDEMCSQCQKDCEDQLRQYQQKLSKQQE